MTCSANHLINGARALSTYDAALSSRFSPICGGCRGPARPGRGRMAHIARDPQQMATIREKVTKMREKSLPNEPKKQHWRYRKRGFSQKTNPNEPKTDPPRPPSDPRQPRPKTNEPTALLPSLASSVPCPSGARACLCASALPVSASTPHRSAAETRQGRLRSQVQLLICPLPTSLRGSVATSLPLPLLTRRTILVQCRVPVKFVRSCLSVSLCQSES